LEKLGRESTTEFAEHTTADHVIGGFCVWYNLIVTCQSAAIVRSGEINMEGIQFVTSDQDQKVAVLIDLRKQGELWEDIYDGLTARQRANEPRETLASVEKRLCPK
jgi:hypothetical protein